MGNVAIREVGGGSIKVAEHEIVSGTAVQIPERTTVSRDGVSVWLVAIRRCGLVSVSGIGNVSESACS